MKRVRWLVLVLLILAAAAAAVHLQLRAWADEAALAPEVVPEGLAVGSSGTVLMDEHRALDFWYWDIPQLLEIVKDSVAGAGGSGVELQTLPFNFSGDLAAGEERVSVEYDPPIRFAVDHFRKADALAVYAPSPSDKVALYLRTPAGKWYKYDTTLPVSRLIRYRETVTAIHKAEGGD